MTTEFLHESLMQRDALGMPELTPVVIDHPLSTLREPGIEDRARQAAARAIAVWLGQSSPDE